MTLSLDDLQMMLSALFEMIAQEPPELAMSPEGEAKLWTMISVDGPQPVQLYLGVDAEMLTRFVKGFGGEEALLNPDPELERSVVKEMANVVGGNLRGAFNIEGALSLPSIIDAPSLPTECFESWDAQAKLWIAIAGMTIDG